MISVAFLGTGLMGYPMARRLAASGLPLVAWNRHLAKAQGLVAEGAKLAESPSQAIANAKLVVLMLADARAVEETLFSSSPPPLAGKVVLQMGTIAPWESAALAEKVVTLGGDYLEAPVLGSVPQAEKGQLTVMVGGPEPIFQQWAQFLAHFGTPTYVGEVGKASTLKLALNNLIAAQAAAFATSLAMVQKGNVNPELFLEILRKSAFYAPSFDRKLPAMLAPEKASVNFPARHMLKDVRLIRAVAEQLGIDATGVGSLETLYEKTLEMGLGDADYAAVAAAIRGKA